MSNNNNVSVPVPNAAPNSILLGVKDDSLTEAFTVREPIPQHVPKFYLRTEKGEVGKDVYGSTADLEEIYGSNTFNIRSKFFNHQTLGASRSLARSNSIVVQRVSGGTARNAGIMYKINVVKKTAANAVGAIDDQGKYIDPSNNNTSSDYYEVVWSKEELNKLPETIPAFSVSDTEAGTSVAIPVFFQQARDPGAYGNNLGNRMFGNFDEALDPRMLSIQKTLPFYMGLVTRPDAVTTGKLKPTLDGIRLSPVSWNPDAVDETTDLSMFIGDVLDEAYANNGDNGLPVRTGPLGMTKVMQDNVDAILEFLFSKEKASMTANTQAVVGPTAFGTGNGTTLPSGALPADLDKYFILTEKDGSKRPGTYKVEELGGRFVKNSKKVLADYITANPGATAVTGNVPDTTPPPSKPPVGASKSDYWVVNDGAGDVAEIWEVRRITRIALTLQSNSTDLDQFPYDHTNTLQIKGLKK